MNMNLGELFLRGGWVMWPLLIFSILTWAVVLERAFVFLTLRPRLARLTQSLMQSLQAGDANAARQVCLTSKPYLSDIFLSTLDSRRPREAAERITERNRVRFMGQLKKNLGSLVPLEVRARLSVFLEPSLESSERSTAWRRKARAVSVLSRAESPKHSSRLRRDSSWRLLPCLPTTSLSLRRIRH